MGAFYDSAGRKGRPSVDRRIAEQAQRQYGVLSIQQLNELGLGARGVHHRAARGLLHRKHRGVYAVGHAVLTADGARMAAVLACGEGAVLSHHSAGALWGLRPDGRARHHVTTPHRSRRGVAGVVLHRTRRLDDDEVTECRGIPVTTVARTLVDLAGELPSDRLARAIHEAEVLRLLDTRAVQALLARGNGRRGIGRLSVLIAEPSAMVTRNELEARFIALCRRHELPLPRMNVTLALRAQQPEVDALWSEQRLVVELDGAAVHHTRRAFERDRRRDLALAAEGYLVVRLTWERITGDADAVAADIRRVLALRGGPH